MKRMIIFSFILFSLCMCNKQEESPIDDYYQYRVDIFNKENETLGPVDVCVIGDSLTDGCDFPKFYPDLKIANRGINGDTTTGVLNRLDCSLINVDMKIVVLYIGINNIDTMLDNYGDILDAVNLHKPDAAKIVLSLTPTRFTTNDLKMKIPEKNEAIKSLAESNDFRYVDIYSSLLDEEGFLKEEYTIDGIHFNDAGYTTIASVLDPIYKSYL